MPENSLENIILIDNNKVSNFFNKITLLNMSIANNIEIFDNSLEALQFFKAEGKNNNLLNNLIFLDLHMPFMNGWEFLDNLQGISTIVNKIRVVIMHDSDLLPEEEVRLYQYSFVESITNKHLEETEILKVLSVKKNNNNLKTIC